MTALLWTEVEANTGVIVACLPSLRAPIVAVYRRVFAIPKTQASNSYGMKTIGSKRTTPIPSRLDQWDVEKSKPRFGFREEEVQSVDSQRKTVKMTDMAVDGESIRFMSVNPDIHRGVGLLV